MIWIILISGFLLRIINLNQSLWLDEAINVTALNNFSLPGIISEYPKYDFHPPGYFAILWVWAKIFGISEIAVRLPSVIFGVANIYLVFLIGTKLLNKKLGLFAAMLLAVNPLHIYYSQEARMYAFAAFAVTLNFLMFINLAKGGKVNYLSLIFYNLLVISSDYLAFLIFPAQFFILLFLKNYQNLKKWSVILLTSILGFAWWIPIFFDQFNIGQMTALSIPGWKMVVGDQGIKALAVTFIKFIIGRIDHPNAFLYGALFAPVAFLISFFIFRAVKLSDKFSRIFLISWLVTPIILALLISFLIPVYSYFRVLFTVPAFVLLLSFGIYKFSRKFLYLNLGLLLLIQLTAAAIYYLNPQFQREDWKGLIQYLKTNQSSSFKILFESNGAFAPFTYYADNSLNFQGALKNFPAKDENDLVDLDEQLRDISDVFLINYLVDISDPKRLVSQRLLSLGYLQDSTVNFHGVGFVYHFKK